MLCMLYEVFLGLASDDEAFSILKRIVTIAEECLVLFTDQVQILATCIGHELVLYTGKASLFSEEVLSFQYLTITLIIIGDTLPLVTICKDSEELEETLNERETIFSTKAQVPLLLAVERAKEKVAM